MCEHSKWIPLVTFLLGLALGFSVSVRSTALAAWDLAALSSSSPSASSAISASFATSLATSPPSAPSAPSPSTPQEMSQGPQSVTEAPTAPAAPALIAPKIGNGLVYLTGGMILQSEGKSVPMIFYKGLPGHLKKLPIVDIGVHDGTDYTIPAAKAGYKVYAYEPTSWKYNLVVGKLKQENILVTNSTEELRRSRSGGVFLRKGVAAGKEPGSTVFTTSPGGGGALNSLYRAAVPEKDLRNAKEEQVTLVTLSDDLKDEKDGLLLLKMDCQGCEYYALLGALDYIKHHKVYSIFLEFYSKGLQAAGVEPLKLLQLLTIDLGYHCFNMRPGTPEPKSLEDFAQMYRYQDGQPGFGRYTDLLCLRLDIL